MALPAAACSVPDIMTFRPTMEEFKDFSGYIAKIESTGAHKAGLAKIIPPEGWCPRRGGYHNTGHIVIPGPIKQDLEGCFGFYSLKNTPQKSMTVTEYEKLAESWEYKTPVHSDTEDIERKFWCNLTVNPPLYGVDVPASLYDSDVNEFNLQRLNTVLDKLKSRYRLRIEGVNTPFLYFGLWGTLFAWHVEDVNLYSINYLHYGAPKTWYVIPPEHAERFEELAKDCFHPVCAGFLKHKSCVISPDAIKRHGIPLRKVTQEAGEFIITFPYAYHSGFNHGYNCAEATNFASPRWVEHANRGTPCVCSEDGVKIAMQPFIRHLQAERYAVRNAGEDYERRTEDPRFSKNTDKPKKRKYKKRKM